MKKREIKIGSGAARRTIEVTVMTIDEAGGDLRAKMLKDALSFGYTEREAKRLKYSVDAEGNLHGCQDDYHFSI